MMESEQILSRAVSLLKTYEHVTLEQANAVQLHDAISKA